MSDYKDGAFYWVRIGRYWRSALYRTVTPCSGHHWHDPWEGDGWRAWKTEGDFDEIGPCIGKEPPKTKTKRAPKESDGGPMVSVELTKALQILLAR